MESAEHGASPDVEGLGEVASAIRAESPAQRNLLLSFERVRANWPDRALHQAFVYEATQANELMFVGSLYRAVMDRWPGDEMSAAAQKQIATSAVFASGLGARTAEGEGRKLPRWVFMSGGMSLAFIIIDFSSSGTFSWLDVVMVVVCLGSIGYAAYRLRS